MIGYFGLPGFVMLGCRTIAGRVLSRAHWYLGGTFSGILAIFAAMFFVDRPETA